MLQIKSLGIDLSSVRSGVAKLRLREDSWRIYLEQAQTLKAGRGVAEQAARQFHVHQEVARQIREIVEEYRPHIVGLEDYTNQPGSHVAFSMGQVGGLVRQTLWECGVRVVLLHPSTVKSWTCIQIRNADDQLVPRTNKAMIKQYVLDYILAPGQELSGPDTKSIEDMCDASVYALIAAFFFARLFFDKHPKLNSRQYEVLMRRTGDVEKFMIRNPDKEGEFYSKTWSPEVPS